METIAHKLEDPATRFAFGENWRLFLNNLNDTRIEQACQSLRDWLQVSDLAGQSFIDIGSGSGLFSLAARRLGARVHSFDYDSASVACTTELKRRFFADDPDWIIERGSALDGDYLQRLGQFDIVYSWGVLHHTGHMWPALANAGERVRPGGKLFIAIYNDQGNTSRRWRLIKRWYVEGGKLRRAFLLIAMFGVIWGPTFLRDTLRLAPLRTWHAYGGTRGMTPWRDLVDWVGGYPFEVARPEEIFDFFKQRGFQMECFRTSGGGMGCNEFMLTRQTPAPCS
jgi:2-polyprenyl-6-hydroxyphenyl methylase/3-demethylubiquinone-9 3-methyltransferase